METNQGWSNIATEVVHNYAYPVLEVVLDDIATALATPYDTMDEAVEELRDYIETYAPKDVREALDDANLREIIEAYELVARDVSDDRER